MLLDPDMQNEFSEEIRELIEFVEDSFDVKLDDVDPAGMQVSELAGNIWKRVEYPAKQKCLSSAVFYSLRQAFVHLLAIPSSSIRPATSVRELLPWRTRRTRWRTMQTHLEAVFPAIVFPPLRFPGWLLLCCLVLPAGALICLKEHFGLSVGWMEFVEGAVAVDVLTILAANPLARCLPRNSETVGDLTKIILARNYGMFATRYGGSSEKEILSALRLLFSYETGLPLDHVLPETIVTNLVNAG